MNRDQLQSIVAALEEGYGDCPHGRTALMTWIEEEISRLKARGIPGGDAATMELDWHTGHGSVTSRKIAPGMSLARTNPPGMETYFLPLTRKRLTPSKVLDASIINAQQDPEPWPKNWG